MDYIDVEKAEAFKNYQKHGTKDLSEDVEKVQKERAAEIAQNIGGSPWQYTGLVCCMVLAYVEALFFLIWSYVLGTEKRFNFALFTLVMAGLSAIFALCLWTAMSWKATHSPKPQPKNNDDGARDDADFEKIDFKEVEIVENVNADLEPAHAENDKSDQAFLENPVLIGVIELTMPMYFYAPWTLLTYGGRHECIIAGVLIAIPACVVLYNLGKLGWSHWQIRKARSAGSYGDGFGVRDIGY